MSMAMPAELDHLVVAGATLAQAIEYVADLTGVTPRPGGQLVAMGTHNALVRLGDRVYLELIAIDPSLPRPPRARWFDLDVAAMQAALGDRPRLVHWVARTNDLERAIANAKVDPGRAHAMSRGDFRWRITIPDDGSGPAAACCRRSSSGMSQDTRRTACRTTASRSSSSPPRIRRPRRSAARSPRSGSPTRCA